MFRCKLSMKEGEKRFVLEAARPLTPTHSHAKQEQHEKHESWSLSKAFDPREPNQDYHR